MYTQLDATTDTCLSRKVKKKMFKKCDFFFKAEGGGIATTKYRLKVRMYALSYFDLFC